MLREEILADRDAEPRPLRHLDHAVLDGKILLDDKAEQAQSQTSEAPQTEPFAATAAVDEDLEFPAVLPDGDVNDVGWVM